jgi:ABC-type multidrug transport system fused ATPase/permease subunit
MEAHSEQDIQQAISSVFKDRTILIVAHRLNTIKSADAILLLDHGKIVEIGTHSDLIKKNSQYGRLYAQYVMDMNQAD